MSNIRITQTEIGEIIHRPATILLPTRRCRWGHFVPYYQSGRNCVACLKNRNALNKMSTYSEYDVAVQAYIEKGGYLFRVENSFCVTDNPNVVRKMRGSEWLLNCEKLQCWDEVAQTAIA